MGFPISPLVVNLFMEDFNARALSTSPASMGFGSGMWMTPLLFTRQNTPSSSLTHLNSLNPHIQFTTEDANQQGSHPFFDTIGSVGLNGLLVTTVYSKPTHMGQHLHWNSHHSISTKYNVVNTLTHRAQAACSDQQLLGQDQLYIRTALSRFTYPDWVFHRLQAKLDYQLSHQDHSTNS